MSPPTSFRALLIGLFLALSVSLARAQNVPGSVPLAMVPFTGQVTDYQSHPIVGAQVMVSTPQGTYRGICDDNGYFSIPAVPSGRASVAVLTRTFEPFLQPVTINGGPVQLQLRHRWATLACHVYTFDWGESHYHPLKVQMWLTGDYAYRSTNWLDPHCATYDQVVYWRPFPMGGEYQVEVTWQDQHGDQRTTRRSGVAHTSFTKIFVNDLWK